MERTRRGFPAALMAAMAVSLWLGTGAWGQGGDVIIPVEPGFVFPAPQAHFLWEQPPVEIDPLSKTPLFCGWDEPAYVEEIPNATEYSTSRPADDFRCLGPMPVTSIHWWGSYHEWQGRIVPAGGPDAWRITFWADTPAGEMNLYSRPGALLHELEVGPARVSVEWVGFDHFPDKPSDSCFRYALALEPAEYFWPSHYEGDIFWIGITAVHKTQKPEHVWGWKTRPAVWMDGAVETVSSYVTTPAGPISGIFIAPIERPDACGQEAKWDMTFALDTDPDWIKWEQPFTGLRTWPYYADESSTATGLGASSIAYKWQQKPDLGPGGLDVDATVDSPETWPAQVLADDFKCTLSGPVTRVELWGSFYQDAPPGNDPNNVEFTLCIHANELSPARLGQSSPGKVLWSRTFKKGQFAVQPVAAEKQDFFSPCNDKYAKDDHKQAWKYMFTIDPSEAFVQTGTLEKPMAYWLSARGEVTQAQGSTARFGWKTAASASGANAVWAQVERISSSGLWHVLTYPGGRPAILEKTALAFSVLTSDESTFEKIDRQVADDWKCEQAAPVVAATWWGSYLGYTDAPCECNEPAEPVRPDYFLLSIWSAESVAGIPSPELYSRPDQKLWEYRAYEYEEVLVGADMEPGDAAAVGGREPVFRYSVRLPPDQQFMPNPGSNFYWFSVVAVYRYPKAANYPWGWTNHEQVFAQQAMFNSEVMGREGKEYWRWQTLPNLNALQDVSFVLFQQAVILGPPPKLP